MADDLWIVDSGPFRAMGLRLPVRMTVIRLANGDLLLHSPTRFVPALRAELEKLGPIRHLVAPNTAHWTMIREWQRACPDAVTWAAPGLRDRAQVKRSGLVIDHDLADATPAAWAAEIEQGIVPGIGGFAELFFFHRSTRTLVLTDLVENLQPAKLPPATRLLMRLGGTLAPDGRAIAFLRAVVRARKPAAAAAARRMVALAPERLIFAHGSWFATGGEVELRRSLRWLL